VTGLCADYRGSPSFLRPSATGSGVGQEVASARRAQWYLHRLWKTPLIAVNGAAHTAASPSDDALPVRDLSPK
jgi:hypothetical protein